MKTSLKLLVLILLFTSCNKIIIKTQPLQELETLSTVAPNVTVANITANENSGSASFSVTIDHAYASPFIVDYALTPVNADHVEDFTVSALSGSLTFSPGETSKSITVNLHNDLVPENNETIDLVLSNPSVGAITNANATMTITDTDSNFFGADVLSLNQITGPSQAPVYYFTTTNTLIVDSSGSGGAYSTIQAAVNAAGPGDQILINTGVYPETVTLTSKGDSTDLPIVLKANSGQTPVLTGAEEISSGSIINANTDGDESAKYGTGFEIAALSNYSFSADPGTGNTAALITDATQAYMGNKFVQLTFAGTDPKSMIFRTFAGFDSYGTGGAKYNARVMVKLSSNFAISGTATQGMTIFRTETNGSATSPFLVKIFPTADPNIFNVNLLNASTIFSGSTTITRGNWVNLELFYKASTTNSSADGLAKLNVNGVNIVNNTSHNSNTTHDRLRLGSPTTSGCPATGTWGCGSGSISYDSLRIEESDVMPALSDNVVNTIYENGMESGLSDFTSSIDSSNTVAASTAQHWDGAQSVRMTFGGTFAQNSLRRTFTPTSDTYARVAFRLNSAFDLAETSDKVTSPAGTDEYTREFDLISLYNSTGSSGRLKVSLLKRGVRFFLLGKILNAKDESQVDMAWTSDTDINNYLQIYKGHLGEIQRNAWNTIEIRYAGDRGAEGGVEIWLNGTSIAANINNSTKKYDGISTRNFISDTVQLGTIVDVNNAGASRVSKQTTLPVNGSEIYFDGLKISTGGPSGLTLPGTIPQIYKYTYATLGAGESLPSTLMINNKVLDPVAALDVVAPGTFYVDSTNRIVYFRMPDDALYTVQKVYSGRRNEVLKIVDSENIVIQNLNIQSGNFEEKGCIHIINSESVKILGNNIKGCDGPAVRIQDTWNAVSRSTDTLISGNSFVDNGKVFGGGVRFDHTGNMVIENNLFDSANGNGIDADCTYDNVTQNLTTAFCTNVTIARNVFAKSVESAIYLTSNTNQSKIYSNIIQSARESGYATQTTNGAWRSSGGSGIHIARGGHDNKVYNNLIYNIDRAGIALRAATVDNIVFNNTIAETGAYIVAAGSSMDFQRDYNETNPAHNDPTKNNVAYNNIYSYTYGTSPCVDLEGYRAGGDPTAGGSAIANSIDLDNMSNNNIFFGCARSGKFNNTSYTTLPLLVSATTTAGLVRENNSQVFSGTLFMDALNKDYSLMTGTTFTAIPFDIKPYLP